MSFPFGRGRLPPPPPPPPPPADSGGPGRGQPPPPSSTQYGPPPSKSSSTEPPSLSSSGGRPPGSTADRGSALTQQEAWIAQKKAEIEAKRQQKQKELDEAGSVSQYRHLHKTPAHGQSTANTGKVGGKNRWGFRGKSSGGEASSTTNAASNNSTTPAASQTKNTFSNDGSFLEQFRRKMQEQQKQQPPEQKFAAASQNPPMVPASTDGHATHLPVKQESPASQEPAAMPTASPALPSKPDAKPKDADEWYKSALERAKQIASSMSKPPQQQQQPTSGKGTLQSDDAPGPSSSSSSSSSSANEYLVKTEHGTEVSAAAAASSTSTNSVSAGPAGAAAPAAGLTAATAAAAIDLPVVADELASLVAVSGDQVEIMARERNMEEEELQFLQDIESDLYKRYRAKVDSLRLGFKEENKVARARKKSRWGQEDEKADPAALAAAAASSAVALPQSSSSSSTPLSNLSSTPGRTNPQLLQYALRVFGTTDLEEHQWKQCEDQIKMNLVYQDLLSKKKKDEELAQKGKRKYEYDSDEDTEDGTWEHKARRLEMEKTSKEAEKLTKQATGRHHIGDFLPPEELTKFLSKYSAIKNGEEYDESDYQDSKLTESNMGFKMLQKMGWNEGSGLGSTGQGITKPVNQGGQSSDKKGLGVNKPHDLDQTDDEFDAYRKRMMLAYRFRPNPLNNPRRSYY